MSVCVRECVCMCIHVWYICAAMHGYVLSAERPEVSLRCHSPQMSPICLLGQGLSPAWGSLAGKLYGSFHLCLPNPRLKAHIATAELFVVVVVGIKLRTLFFSGKADLFLKLRFQTFVGTCVNFLRMTLLWSPSGVLFKSPL